MFYIARSPVWSDTQPFAVYRRPERIVVGHAQTREGARDVLRALYQQHIAKRCLCASTGRLCCDEQGYVLSK
jgi:hypothetical protein